MSRTMSATRNYRHILDSSLLSHTHDIFRIASIFRGTALEPLSARHEDIEDNGAPGTLAYFGQEEQKVSGREGADLFPSHPQTRNGRQRVEEFSFPERRHDGPAASAILDPVCPRYNGQPLLYWSRGRSLCIGTPRGVPGTNVFPTPHLCQGERLPLPTIDVRMIICSVTWRQRRAVRGRGLGFWCR